MTESSPTPQPQATPPSFFGQGVLILLPSLILAGIGVAYLRHEHAIAEREIAEDAAWVVEQLRDDLEQRFERATNSTNSTLRRVPLESLDAASILPPDPGASGRDLAAGRRYDDAIRRLKGGKAANALADLENLLAFHPDARTASGLPLRPLILYQQLRHLSPDEDASPLIHALLKASIVTHPSTISPALIERAKRIAVERDGRAAVDFDDWTNRWSVQDGIRGLLASHRETLIEEGDQWVGSGPQSVYAAVLPGDLVQIFALDELVAFTTAAAHDSTRVPRRDPLAFDIDIGGRVLQPFVRGGSPESRRPVAQTSGDRFRVAAFLADPESFNARVRRQTIWLGSLIASALACAVLGAALTRRALIRQHRLNALQSNFVASVSHELRAPVASVRLLAERLQAGQIESAGEQKQYFSLIGRECRRLAALVANVLDFARIDQGRKGYNLAETDLPALVRDTVELTQPLAEERGVILHCNTEPIPADPHLDPIAIQQALANLIDNAVKYSPAGAEVNIALKPRAGSSELELSVTDHGPGIPEAERARIFDRFYRIGSELRRETEGVGIGLSIVKHIAEGHGGRVEVESAPGKGSTFTIILPLNSTQSTTP